MKTTIAHMKKLTLLLIAAWLVGCASSKEIIGPNGTKAYSIRCGAAAAEECLEKAGEVCPSGYLVLDRQGAQYLGQYGSGSVSGNWGQAGGSVRGSAYSIPMATSNTMLIQCK